jgi:hypothetical protein
MDLSDLRGLRQEYSCSTAAKPKHTSFRPYGSHTAHQQCHGRSGQQMTRRRRGRPPPAGILLLLFPGPWHPPLTPATLAAAIATLASAAATLPAARLHARCLRPLPHRRARTAHVAPPPQPIQPRSRPSATATNFRQFHTPGGHWAGRAWRRRDAVGRPDRAFFDWAETEPVVSSVSRS